MEYVIYKENEIKSKARSTSNYNARYLIGKIIRLHRYRLRDVMTSLITIKKKQLSVLHLQMYNRNQVILY